MATANQTQYTLTPSQLVRMIAHLMSRQKSNGDYKEMVAPFIWGGPGIGKTELVRTIARSRKSRIVALHLPQYDPTDIKGIPVRDDDGKVRWIASTYLPASRKMLAEKIGDDPVHLTWDYAIDIAVYGFDKNGVEVMRWNDPCLNDMGDAKIELTRTDLKEWDVTIGKLPKDVVTVQFVDKAIVFLDELSAAETSTQNAALQLVLDRRVGEYEIPTAVPIVAAGNREDDGAFVQPLSHPLGNRFLHITLVPNPDDFIEWGMVNNVRPEILGFVTTNPDCFEDYDKGMEAGRLSNGELGFLTPRSLKFLSDQYEDIEFFKEMATGDAVMRTAEAERLRSVMFAGLIGAPEASRLVDYLAVMHDLPSVEEIVSGRAKTMDEVERSQSFGLLYALIQNIKYRHDKYFDSDLSDAEQPKQWTDARENIINFITENFSRESGAWAASMLFEHLDIDLPALRGDAMMRFSKEHVHVVTRSMRKSK